METLKIIYLIVSIYISLVTCIYFINTYSPEQFKNRLIESVPVDIQLSNSNTYFYEKNNADFEQALNVIFGIDPKRPDLLSVDDSFTYASDDDTVINAYTLLINYVKSQLAENSATLANPGSNESVFVFSDNLIRYKLTTPQTDDDIRVNGLDNTQVIMYFLDIEMVLFRFGAFEGKHVFLRGTIDKNNIINVYYVKILGTVFADKLYMGNVIGYEGSSYSSISPN